MADNIPLNPGSGGATLASDDIGGVQIQRVKVCWGADGSFSDTDIASGKALPVYRALGLSAVVSVTRPANTTGYGAGDVLGPAAGTSGIDFSMGALSGSAIKIGSVSLERDVAALISGETSYNLYLYSVTPPSALADNAVFDIPSGDRASFLGKIALGTPIDEGSTLYIETNNINKIVRLAGTHLFGYLVTVGAYTPASATVLKVTIHAEQL